MANKIEMALQACADWGLIPTSFRQCMTWEEQVLWLSKFLKEQVIPTLNGISDQVNELQTWFDNLNVQEEINNKLDEMAESGELMSIIAEYIGLGALITFNTLDDAIASTELAIGSKVKTLGKHTLGDGFGAYYNVDETGEIEVANGLFLTLVPNFGGHNYYDEVTFTKSRANNSDYYITTIPVLDNENKLIKPYIARTDFENYETPNGYARANFTTLTCNATLNTGRVGFDNGSVISNGVILEDKDPADCPRDYLKYIGIKPDREVLEFDADSTTAQQMLTAGCEQAWLAYFKIIDNGVKLDLTTLAEPGLSIATNKHPRQCIGVKADKTIVMLTVDGRTIINDGMTCDECADILLGLGCINAWNLDGGGSASTSIKGCKINRDIDDGGTSDRRIEYVLNVKKEIIDEELAKVYSQIGAESDRLSDTLTENINAISTMQYIVSGDLNDEVGSVIKAYIQNCDNSPAQSGYLINIPHSQLPTTYGTQFLFARDNNKSYQRRLINGEFSPWILIAGGAQQINSSSSSTLSADNTYENLTFTSTSTSGDIANLLSFVDEDTETHKFKNFKIILNGATRTHGHTVRVTARAQILSNSTAADRYLAINYNGTTSLAGGAKVTMSANTTQTLIAEGVFDDVNNAKNFSIQAYGKAGDTISRCSVTIEVIE